MKFSCRHVLTSLALFSCSVVCAAPYPAEGQLRTAIATGAGLLKAEGVRLEVFDSQKEGMTQPLLAAGLTLDGTVCRVFFNTRPESGLTEFFATFQENEMPVLLNALAVHEAMHCLEQREAVIHRRFEKVLPADMKRDTVTVQGYLSVLQSGALVTWGEALADIASVLYLQQVVPAQWAYFANRLAAMRHDLAAKWADHDTSAWLHRITVEDAGPAANTSLFEAALQLRGQYRPVP
jgi:hypothetical protein